MRMHTSISPLNYSDAQVKDDNDKMVEWVAYHHFTLPLTRVVVCEEPGNQEYVKDRFANTAWEDMVKFDYLIAGVDFYNTQQQRDRLKKAKIRSYNHQDATLQHSPYSFHRPVQMACFEHCMQMLKSEGATWTLFLDTDEFLVVDSSKTGTSSNNKRNDGASSNANTPRWPWEQLVHPTMPKTQNYLQPWLDYPPFARRSCAYLPRVMYSNVTEARRADDLFTTRKYRQHTTVGSMPGKAVLDVSKLNGADMENSFNPHNEISPACTRPVVTSVVKLHPTLPASRYLEDQVMGVPRPHPVTNLGRGTPSVSSRLRLLVLASYNFLFYADVRTTDDVIHLKGNWWYYRPHVGGHVTI